MGASVSIDSTREYTLSELKGEISNDEATQPITWSVEDEEKFNQLVNDKNGIGLTKNEILAAFATHFNQPKGGDSSQSDSAAAITRIQSRARGNKTRTEANKKKQAATVLQSRARGMNARHNKKPVDRSTLPSTATRCVSLAFLIRFTNHYNMWHKQTKDVVKEVIVPATSEIKSVWSDLEDSQSLLMNGDVGPPQVFVSHAWSNIWGLLVLSLKFFAETHHIDPQKLICWIDVFVINQHNYMQELKQLDEVIKLCANFIQVVDTETALPLRRVWCLYEVMARLQHCTKKSGGLVIVVGSVVSVVSAADASNDNVSGEEKVQIKLAEQEDITRLFETVDMQKAEASYPADVEMIFKRVRETIKGGFTTVNNEVRTALVECACRTAFAVAAAEGRNGKTVAKPKRTKVEDLYAGLE
mmetsp:Transcript_7926/g.13142  ORF Transcript_7926/g.13142 Transcript_7926/m.13142 type:complete len:415 (-) Transcript_7926:180-1424(-)|eukprot:CAMPEP_0174953936 /NCGR_PEP_ID=MMETSP0004_2-20121128/144_1 /TAXON_ID=420556 /ORGANISM="Ochromonas sp., Strain CCMP1393" /LENGTH=414 /DNA_ID=CAMNT_0016201691 /DNA_START=139 /DNA_END=1383 /DNA_ORIENTATION=+